MTSNLCSEYKNFPAQHYCSLCKTVLVCAMCYLKRGLVELTFVCATCDKNGKNDTIGNEYTVTEDSTVTEVHEPPSKVLKPSPVIDGTIQFSSSNIGTVSTAAAITEVNNVSAGGAVFNAASSGITLSSFKTSYI